MDQNFRVEGIQQIAQRATNLDESVAFYRDVLRLTFIARFDPPGLAFFDLNGTRLLLEAPASPALIYLRVRDPSDNLLALASRKRAT